MKHSRPLLIVGTLTLLAVGATRHIDAVSDAPPPREVPPLATAKGPPAQPGTFPATWINGVDCDTEPVFQVHPYNDDLYIIRQSKCATFEAPFLYLIFGEAKALLMDTGSAPATDVYGTVQGVIDQWLVRNKRTSIPLIVAHTHSHGDHFQGDGQFRGRPNVEQVVGLDQASVEAFWGFKDFPNDIVTIDLGNRVLDVIATPGHQPASVTLYDRATHLLLTGDIIYSGHVFIFSPGHWRDYVASLRRMVDFTSTHPVQWLVGCHIEYSNTPGVPYAYGTAAHPDEHVLQLDPKILRTMLRAAWSMGDDPECRIYDEFVVHIVYECGIGWNG